MFYFGKNEKKYCEICSRPVNVPYYTVLFSVSHLFDSTCPQMNRVDRQNKKISLQTGQTFDFTFEIEPGIFVKAEQSTEHLLCSEICEDEFISKHLVNYVKGNLPVYDYRHMKIFSPIAIPSIRLGGNQQKCSHCGVSYKYKGRNWLKCKIKNSVKVSGSFDKKPNIDFSKFSIVLSGLSSKNPTGDWYGYQPDYKNSEYLFLCSYDCAYKVIKNRSEIIIVNSVLEKERMGAIVNETELINQLLNNAPHRPTFFRTMLEIGEKPSNEFDPDYRDVILYNGHIPFRATGNFIGDFIEIEQFNNPNITASFNTNFKKQAYIGNHHRFDLVRCSDGKSFRTFQITVSEGTFVATGRIFKNDELGIILEHMMIDEPTITRYFNFPLNNNFVTGEQCLRMKLH